MTAPSGWWRRTRTARAVYADVDALLADGHPVAHVARVVGVAETTVSARRRATTGLHGGLRSEAPGSPLTRRQLRALARLLDVDEPTHVKAAADLGTTVGGLDSTLTRAYRKLAVRSLVGAQRVLLLEQDRRLPEWREPLAAVPHDD